MKTKDSLKILNKRLNKSKELAYLVEKERTYMDIAITLRQTRKTKGLTQAKLAKLADTTQSDVSRLENGDFDGDSLKILGRLATAMYMRLIIQFDSI